MGGRRFDRNSVSGNRRGAGAVCRDLAEGSDDLSGMYWNRIRGNLLLAVGDLE